MEPDPSLFVGIDLSTGPVAGSRADASSDARFRSGKKRDCHSREATLN